MSTTVTLDTGIVRAVQRETRKQCEATAVRLALSEYLRTQKMRRLGDLAGQVELQYANNDLERLEEI